MALQTAHDNTTFHVGDTIQVHYKIIEKEVVAGKAKREVKEEIRERTQTFAGTVISIRGEGQNKSFTVRKIATGAIGVERIYPLHSPWIKKIEVVKKAKVRRAKLYYLRQKQGREAENVKEKQVARTPAASPKKTASKKSPVKKD